MTNPDNTFQWRYVPELDGLRAIAVAFVFLFHVIGTWFYLPNGWFGVDIFFVLSGFLITALLVKEFQTYKRISLKNFYIRRFLRLLPALIMLLILVNTVGRALGQFTPDLLFLDSLGALFYVSNWVYAFDLLPRMYLQHTWSLAIEEQYYIIWAIFVAMLLIRTRNIKHIFYGALGIALLSMFWRIVLLHLFDASSDRIYFALDTRLDGLLLGSALGVFIYTDWFARLANSIKQRSSLLLMSLCLIALALLARLSIGDFVFNYTVLIPIVNLITLIFIVCVIATPDNLLKTLLRHPIPVHIGRISYGIYLYHILVVGVLRQTLTLSPEWLFFASFAITLIVAELSYRLLEQPILRLKTRFGSAS